MEFFFIALIATVLLVPACYTDSPLHYGDVDIRLPNDSLTLDFRDTLFFDDQTHWVLFDTLYDDSRCPTELVCVWMGNASLGFQLNGDRFALNTHPDFRRDTTLQQYRVTLLNVSPYPVADSVYSSNDYSPALRIRKLQ